MDEHADRQHTGHENTDTDDLDGPEAGLMDTRRGVVSDENRTDAAIPAKRSLGWGVIIPALLWIGLGAIIVTVVIINT